MGYSKYRLNKIFRKVTLLTFLLACIISSLSLINNTLFETFLNLSPFHSDVSKFTNIFESILSPRCSNFTEYNLDSQPYWQFYGFQHHMKLNQETLSNILKIDSKQEDEMMRLHNELLNNYLTTSFKPFADLQNKFNENDKNNNKGIIYVSGKKYYWLTMISIKYIRDILKDKTPIEVFVPIKSNDDQHCNKMTMVFSNVKCTYFSDYLSHSQIKKLSGYQYKSLALLLTNFNDVLYLDSDNIPISNINDMFENPNYLKSGFVSWADFWKRSTNYKFYKMSGIEGVASPISSTPSAESGQILINKKSHLKTLLLAYYYNYYGPGYFYPLFSQGFPGEGDKETFYLAGRVTGEGAFMITGQKTKSFGYINNKNSYVGQGILQFDPNNPSRYWFLHLNYPKLNVAEMLKNGYFSADKGQRYWTTIRYAQDDSKRELFRQSVGRDLEYEVWKLMFELLSKDFKGFLIFNEIGNDEMADYVKEHLVKLENSKIGKI
ncbi:hypothetical protein C6P40_001894 [Pichia californica]|uniref:Glycosyltransferase family 71 protein n=1 Tax=Pichia californica TaxID=460514 RepID=A0A9P7BD83_9ASCO|nr:hypothetical protein C6P42_001916 [[Candida] californica]KAG0687767.1 hypothetical protein C6P40_001894 [[Candida] californica]